LDEDENVFLGISQVQITKQFLNF